MDRLESYFISDIARIIYKSIFDRPSPPRILSVVINEKIKTIIKKLNYDIFRGYGEIKASQLTLQRLVSASGLKPMNGDLIQTPKEGSALIYHGERYYPVTLAFNELIISYDKLPILSYYPLNYWGNLFRLIEIDSSGGPALRAALQNPRMKAVRDDESDIIEVIEGSVRLIIPLINTQEDVPFPLEDYFPLDLEDAVEQAIGYHLREPDTREDNDTHLGEGELLLGQVGAVVEYEGGYLIGPNEAVIRHGGKNHRLTASSSNTLYIPSTIPMVVSYNIFYWQNAIRDEIRDYGVILNLDHIPEKNRIYKQVLDNLRPSKKNSWDTYFTYSGEQIYIIIAKEIISQAVSLLTKPIWWLRNEENNFVLETIESA